MLKLPILLLFMLSSINFQLSQTKILYQFSDCCVACMGSLYTMCETPTNPWVCYSKASDCTGTNTTIKYNMLDKCDGVNSTSIR